MIFGLHRLEKKLGSAIVRKVGTTKFTFCGAYDCGSYEYSDDVDDFEVHRASWPSCWAS